MSVHIKAVLVGVIAILVPVIGGYGLHLIWRASPQIGDLITDIVMAWAIAFCAYALGRAIVDQAAH